MKIMSLKDGFVRQVFDNVSSSEIHSAVFIANPGYSNEGDVLRLNADDGKSRFQVKSASGSKVSDYKEKSKKKKKNDDETKDQMKNENLEKSKPSPKKTSTNSSGKDAKNVHKVNGDSSHAGKTNGFVKKEGNGKHEGTQVEGNMKIGTAKINSRVNKNSLTWQMKSRLYFMNKKQVGINYFSA